MGVTLRVMLIAGCAAWQPEAPAGLATTEQQTARAASRAERPPSGPKRQPPGPRWRLDEPSRPPSGSRPRPSSWKASLASG